MRASAITAAHYRWGPRLGRYEGLEVDAASDQVLSLHVSPPPGLALAPQFVEGVAPLEAVVLDGPEEGGVALPAVVGPPGHAPRRGLAVDAVAVAPQGL